MKTDASAPHKPHPIYLKDYVPPNISVDHVHLTVQIFEGYTGVINRMQITRRGEGPLRLNGEHLDLISVHVNDVAIEKPDYDGKILTIHDWGDQATFVITTRIHPEKNTRLEGLYYSGSTYCTQCEPEGFRALTLYPDRSDVMSVFTVRIEADRERCPILLSNGNMIEQGALDNGRHYTLWHDPFKKPCYLFALVAGDLVKTHDHFITQSGRRVDLAIYTRESDAGQVRHAMESLKKSMRWDEVAYGREYDLDLFNIVAVSDFNFGAMENKSLNIFNTALVLADSATATDQDFFNVESVVAHEYFHNWSGNRVTCRDWFQLTLKEGLTVFREQQFSAYALGSESVQRIDDVTQLRRLQFTEDGGPLAHPIRPESYIEINNFYTMTVYEKGSEVIRMLHTLLGPDQYRRGTDLYFSRHDGQAVTCDDFIACLAEVSGQDLSQFMHWYRYAGTPHLTAVTDYDPDSKRFTLTLKQHVPDTPGQTDKPPFVIPVALGLLGSGGDEIQATRMLILDQPEQRFIIENVASKPVPSILRHFSAPVTLTTDLSDDDYLFLMVHDTDGFNRWDAGQTVARRVLGRMIDAPDTAREQATSLVLALKTLIDQAADPAADRPLLARMLTLPDIVSLMAERTHVNPAAIYTARQNILGELAEQAFDAARHLYAACRDTGPYVYSNQAMAKRAICNTVLRVLMASTRRRPEAIALAQDHYAAATNMTDRIAALSCLVDCADPVRDPALADYFNRFHRHELATNKWFAIQAMANRPGVIDDVKQLTRHADFRLNNPNRARALFGSFGMNNPVAFHDESGGGYDVLVEAIQQLNAINPQVASRLMTPFRDWRRMTSDRQELMRKALERILATPDLSNDVFEIASKSLAG